MAYNNHIIRFTSDSELDIINCRITGLGIDATLYPNPSGEFMFNLKTYITAAINTKNFFDDIETDLISDDSLTFTYNASEGFYVSGNLLIRINFDDETFETETRSLKFITGVQQLEDYKKNQIAVADSDYLVLTPVSERTSHKTYMKYWQGYPFDISIYTNLPAAEFNLKNHSNAVDYNFLAKGSITSLVLSDGRTDTTIENFLPLSTGGNNLEVRYDDGSELETRPLIYLEKSEAECGIYVKFINNLGRWSYWLFSKAYFRDLAGNTIGVIENDFNNLEDTISPALILGRNTRSVLKVIADKLTGDQKDIVQQMMESPKILMFTGTRFSRSSFNDWVEIYIRTSNISVAGPNRKKHSIIYEFDLPNRYVQTL